MVSSIDKKKNGFVYHDHWTTYGDYIYSGEGKTGDQKMTSGNKAIVEAKAQGKQIHLFVKFSPQEYYYQGIFPWQTIPLKIINKLLKDIKYQGHN